MVTLPLFRASHAMQRRRQAQNLAGLSVGWSDPAPNPCQSVIKLQREPDHMIGMPEVRVQD